MSPRRHRFVTVVKLAPLITLYFLYIYIKTHRKRLSFATLYCLTSLLHFNHLSWFTFLLRFPSLNLPVHVTSTNFPVLSRTLSTLKTDKTSDNIRIVDCNTDRVSCRTISCKILTWLHIFSPKFLFPWTFVIRHGRVSLSFTPDSCFPVKHKSSNVWKLSA